MGTVYCSTVVVVVHAFREASSVLVAAYDDVAAHVEVLDSTDSTSGQLQEDRSDEPW